MATRTRIITIPDKVGWRTDRNGSLTINTPPSLYQKTIDTVKEPPYTGHPFTVDRWYHVGGYMNGTRSDLPTVVCSDYRPDNFGFEPGFTPSISGVPSNSDLATKLLKMTNPSRPVVDLPVFIYELKDLPDLIRVEGKKILRDLSNFNLNYQFAIKPMLSDLKKMFDFTKAVDDRQKEIEQLRTRGLSRTRILWTGSNSETRTVAVHSAGQVSCSVKQTSFNSMVIKGHVKWYPTSNLPQSGSPEARLLAEKLILGMNGIGLATLWEAIPWSWAIDWFSNVGDYLAATRNSLPCTHSQPLIMKSESVVHKGTVASITPGISMSDYERGRHYNTRVKASPALSAQLSVLDLRQTSILGSIALLKGTRAKRNDPRNPWF